MARKMVCEWGMSELGPLTFGKKEEQIFLGREIAQHRDFSEETAMKIDVEVRKIVDLAYQSARQVLENDREALIRVAQTLLEREVLDANELKMVIEGKELPRPPAPTDNDGAPQHVLKPELKPERAPGMAPGQQPA
jgi:cell division protease FtsH